MSIYRVVSLVGINTLLRSLTARRGRVLVYHGVTKQVPEVFNWQQIRLDRFVEHMRYLKKHYNVVPLPVILEHMTRKKEFPKRCVALTFDDGYENNFSVVYPLLKELNFPATFFISTAFIENGNKSLWFDAIYNEITNHRGSEIDLSSCGFGIVNTSTTSAKSRAIDWLCDELKTLSYVEMEAKLQCILKRVEIRMGEPVLFPGMNWEQVRTLAADPLITIGGHSHRHLVLTNVSEEEAWKEIIINKQLLEKNIGKSVTVFSYPNGNWNSKLISLLKRAGYEFALTVEENFVTSRPYAIERITVRNPSSQYLFEAVVSGLVPVTRRYLKLSTH
jgi:peptidoglycan/xylan/chitin deacetylase (PgdA/CDA1 family)